MQNVQRLTHWYNWPLIVSQLPCFRNMSIFLQLVTISINIVIKLICITIMYYWMYVFIFIYFLQLLLLFFLLDFCTFFLFVLQRNQFMHELLSYNTCCMFLFLFLKFVYASIDAWVQWIQLVRQLEQILELVFCSSIVTTENKIDDVFSINHGILFW